MRSKARGEAAMKSTRQAPKNPRKNNNKNSNNAEFVAEAVSSSMAAMEIGKCQTILCLLYVLVFVWFLVYICLIYQRKLLRQQNPKAEQALGKLLLRLVSVSVPMFYFSLERISIELMLILPFRFSQKSEL